MTALRWAAAGATPDPRVVEAVAGLGVDAYRLTLSWARLQPAPDGPLDDRELDRLRAATRALRRAGVDPVIALGHDAPLGAGWGDRATAQAYGRLAGRVAGALGDDVAAWTTLTRPWRLAFAAPTGAEALAAAHHLSLGHGLAAAAVRAELGAAAVVGVELDLHVTHPANATSSGDLEAVARIDAAGNHVFLGPVLDGSYPVRLRRQTVGASDWSFVRPGDLEVTRQRVDVLGVSYDGSRLVRRGPGNGGAPWVGADDVEHVAGPGPDGLFPDPEGLTELLTALDNAYPELPLVAVPTLTGTGTAAVGHARALVAATAEAGAAGAGVRGFVAGPAVGGPGEDGLLREAGGALVPTELGQWYAATVRAGAPTTRSVG
ncbi:family 1 glycosylhydrolase [Georgenia faecalis]|uniref:Family 1 glycosylhydrolase n=1 Tax=Georgenia faecalis TaxID=2483799 RepID=A0ABV9DB06_9MICO|nr:family 1 glycosylhydrolase [Georgenia faecalis]